MNDMQSEKSDEQLKKEANGKKLAKTAAKAGGQAIAGPLGAKAVDKISNTKAGNKLFDKAGQTLTKAPGLNKALESDKTGKALDNADKALNTMSLSKPSKSSNTSSAFNSNKNLESNSEEEGNDSLLSNPFKKKKKKQIETEEGVDVTGLFNNKIVRRILISAIGFFIVIMIFVASIAAIMAPVFVGVEWVDNAKSNVSSFFSSLGNWFTFKGWCATDEECLANAEEEYYKKLNELAEQYRADGVELDIQLLGATVMYRKDYSSGFGTAVGGTDDVNESIDSFRNGTSKLATLAREMVTANSIDLNKYYSYLINSYVEQNYSEYLKDLQGAERTDRIKKIAEEIMIFSDDWEGYTGAEPYGKGGCQFVTVTNRDGGIIGVFPVEYYVAGVITAENNGPTESRKAQAVLARTYLNSHNRDKEDCTIESSSRKQNYRTPSKENIEIAYATAGEIWVGPNGELFGTEYDSFYTNTGNGDGGTGNYHCDDKYCYSTYYKKGPGSKSSWKTHVLKIPISYQRRFYGGHGRGMSQVMANYLAKDEGYKYVQLLQYFYADGCKLVKLTDGYYADGLTFPSGTTSFNGTFYYFSQTDYRQGFDNGRTTISAAGCGVTSLAMVVSSLTGNVMDPVAMEKVTCAKYSCSVGTSPSAMTGIPQKYGLKAKAVSGNTSGKQAVIDALASGNSLVIAHMGPGHFTSNGHYIVLGGVNDKGQVFVYDPNNGKKRGKNKYWSLSLVASELKGKLYIISR